MTNICGMSTFTLQIQERLFEVIDLVVDLNAAAGRFQHKDSVFGINVHGHRSVKAPLRLQIHAAASLQRVEIGLNVFLGPGGKLLRIPNEGGDEVTVRSKDLQPVVMPVRDIDVPFRVYRHV